MFSLHSFFIFIGQALKFFRFSAIASHLTRRTDNEINNFWNLPLKKLLLKYISLSHQDNQIWLLIQIHRSCIFGYSSHVLLVQEFYKKPEDDCVSFTFNAYLNHGKKICNEFNVVCFHFSDQTGYLEFETIMVTVTTYMIKTTNLIPFLIY